VVLCKNKWLLEMADIDPSTTGLIILSKPPRANGIENFESRSNKRIMQTFLHCKWIYITPVVSK
jgi:hypothetical protein